MSDEKYPLPGPMYVPPIISNVVFGTARPTHGVDEDAEEKAVAEFFRQATEIPSPWTKPPEGSPPPRLNFKDEDDEERSLRGPALQALDEIFHGSPAAATSEQTSRFHFATKTEPTAPADALAKRAPIETLKGLTYTKRLDPDGTVWSEGRDEQGELKSCMLVYGSNGGTDLSKRDTDELAKIIQTVVEREVQEALSRTLQPTKVSTISRVDTPVQAFGIAFRAVPPPGAPDLSKAEMAGVPVQFRHLLD